MAGKGVGIAFRHPIHDHSDEHTDGDEGELAADRSGRKRGGAHDEAVYRGRDSALVGLCLGVAPRSSLLIVHATP